MILNAISNEPDAPEGQPRNDLLSKKDIRNLGIALVFIVLLLLPVYLTLRKGRDKHLCVQNMKAIGQALQLYAIDNTDRLPPTYATNTGREPALYNGIPLTWMTVIANRMSSKASFLCPSAQPDEQVKNVNPGLKSIEGPIVSSYGMYGAWSAFPRSYVSNPNESILVAETSNRGSGGTYNPLPFKSGDTPAPYDGFIIGLDTSNFTPAEGDNPTTHNGAKWATRLAFSGTAQGEFGSKGASGRHDTGIHALNNELQLIVLKPAQAKIQRIGVSASSDIIGIWRTR